MTTERLASSSGIVLIELASMTRGGVSVSPCSYSGSPFASSSCTVGSGTGSVGTGAWRL